MKFIELIVIDYLKNINALLLYVLWKSTQKNYPNSSMLGHPTWSNSRTQDLLDRNQ